MTTVHADMNCHSVDHIEIPVSAKSRIFLLNAHFFSHEGSILTHVR